MGGAGDVRLDAALVDAADAHDAESSALGDAFARALAGRSDDDEEVTAAPGDAADVLTVEEVAALLKVGRNAIYDAVTRREIPHARIGKQIRFSRAAIVRWLSSCEAADKEHR